MKLPISLVVITFNEEEHIERCIRSASFASEVLIVDSFSTDRTVEIAQSLGAKVIQQKWLGFGAQKKFATEKATQDWVLSLDADECVSPEMAKEIEHKFSTLQKEEGVVFPRLSYHLKRWIRHGGWYPDYQLRLFNKTQYNWNTDGLHEKVEVKKKIHFSQPIQHYVFSGISDQVKTNDRYSGIGADQLSKKGRRFSLLKLVYKPPVKFIECYFVKLGFLDGLPGFIIAVGAAYSIFLRWAKLWELQSEK